MKKETDGQRETVIEGKELNYTYPGTKTPVWEKNLTFIQQVLHAVCVLAQAEEVCLLLGVVDLPAAVGALA